MTRSSAAVSSLLLALLVACHHRPPADIAATASTSTPGPATLDGTLNYRLDAKNVN